MPVTNAYIELQLAEDTWTPTLDEIATQMADLDELYPMLWAVFRQIEARRFSAEGPGWPALAPSTVAGRVAQGIGGNHPMLNRSGAAPYGDVNQKPGSLRKSFTTKSSKYSYMEPMPDGLFVGSKHPLAIYHQTGAHGAGKYHDVTIPARPIVDMNQADAELFSTVISDYIFGLEVARTALYDAGDTEAVEVDSDVGADVVGAGV